MFPRFRHIRNIERVRQGHIRTILTDRSNPFEAMTQEEFLRRFRLSKECTLSLIEKIENQFPDAINNKGKFVYASNFLY